MLLGQCQYVCKKSRVISKKNDTGTRVYTPRIRLHPTRNGFLKNRISLDVSFTLITYISFRSAYASPQPFAALYDRFLA